MANHPTPIRWTQEERDAVVNALADQLFQSLFALYETEWAEGEEFGSPSNSDVRKSLPEAQRAAFKYLRYTKTIANQRTRTSFSGTEIKHLSQEVTKLIEERFNASKPKQKAKKGKSKVKPESLNPEYNEVTAHKDDQWRDVEDMSSKLRYEAEYYLDDYTDRRIEAGKPKRLSWKLFRTYLHRMDRESEFTVDELANAMWEIHLHRQATQATDGPKWPSPKFVTTATKVEQTDGLFTDTELQQIHDILSRVSAYVKEFGTDPVTDAREMREALRDADAELRRLTSRVNSFFPGT